MTKRKKQIQGQRANKRKKPRFWIERVQETHRLQNSCSTDTKFVLTISRSLLSDNQTYGPLQQGATLEDETSSSYDTWIAESATPESGVATGTKGRTMCVHFDPSMNQRVPQYQNKSRFRHLPNGDCGDGVVNPSPGKIQNKYWAQRKRLFSKFDEGIEIDQEGWYSVTPEAIARHTATRLCSSDRSSLVVFDLFAGVGGNTIAFALHPDVKLVVAVDNSRTRLDMAAKNAKVYGVPEERIRFVQADVFDIINLYKDGKRADELSSDILQSQLPDCADAMFASPPWGGPDYTSTHACFPLPAMSIGPNHTCEDLLINVVNALGKSGKSAFFLPKNIDGANVARVARDAGASSCELEQNVIDTKLKAITMYIF